MYMRAPLHQIHEVGMTYAYAWAGMLLFRRRKGPAVTVHT